VNFGNEVYPLDKEVVTFRTESRLVGEQNRTYVVNSKRALGFGFNGTSPPDVLYSFFSGPYKAYFNKLVNERPVYYQGSKDVASGKFYYCDPQKSWVFTVEAFKDANAIPIETMNGNCDHGWLLRSPITEAFKLEDVPTDGWRIWTGSFEVASDFSFTCAECDSNLDCGLNRGECKGGACHCNNKGNEGPFEGPFCNADPSCDSLINFFNITETAADGVAYGSTNYAKMVNFADDSALTAYDRPTYFSVMNEAEIEVILYTGRRWYDAYFSPAEAFLFLQPLGFHAYWGDVVSGNVKFYSETTDSQLPTGVLKWYGIRTSRSAGNYGPFGASFDFHQIFECWSVDCNIKNVCGAANKCEPNANLGRPNNATIYSVEEGNTTRLITGGWCDCSNTEDYRYPGHFCEYI
jgi:hypothetical protein